MHIILSPRKKKKGEETNCTVIESVWVKNFLFSKQYTLYDFHETELNWWMGLKVATYFWVRQQNIMECVHRNPVNSSDLSIMAGNTKTVSAQVNLSLRLLLLKLEWMCSSRGIVDGKKRFFQVPAITFLHILWLDFGFTLSPSILFMLSLFNQPKSYYELYRCAFYFGLHTICQYVDKTNTFG